jgi:hypothetical protein
MYIDHSAMRYRQRRAESRNALKVKRRSYGLVSRVSRFGDIHWIFGQEREISCGVACVIMAAFTINKITPGSRAMFTEADILDSIDDALRARRSNFWRTAAINYSLL